MLVYYANITFHSGDKIQKIFDDESQKSAFENALSSDSRFIKIDGDLYAIASISSINFKSEQKIKRAYEELSPDNQKLIDENPNSFPFYEITKSIGNTNNL